MIRLLRSGEIPLGTFVWCDGMKQWARVEETLQFGSHFAAVSESATGQPSQPTVATQSEDSTPDVAVARPSKRSIITISSGLLVLCIFGFVAVEFNSADAKWSHKALTDEKFASGIVGGFNDDGRRLYHQGLQHIRNQHKRIGAFTIGEIIDGERSREEDHESMVSARIVRPAWTPGSEETIQTKEVAAINTLVEIFNKRSGSGSLPTLTYTTKT